MHGDPNGNFRPQSGITRAETAAVLVRTQLFDFSSPTELPYGMTEFNIFADVRPSHWFYYYVAWAYDAGLIVGDPVGPDGQRRFRPSDHITRQEFAAIVTRIGDVFIPENGFLLFNDWNHVQNWARQYVYTAYLAGWVQGDPLGNFRPRDNISRAEVATAINRVLRRIDGWDAFDFAEFDNLYARRIFPDVRDSAWFFPSVVAASNDHWLLRCESGYIIWVRLQGSDGV